MQIKTLLVVIGLLSGLATAQAQNATDQPYREEINRHRQHYKQEFLEEERAPIKGQDTALLDFFAPDIAWKIQTRLVQTPDAQPFDMPTYSGRTARYRQYGTLQFEVGGKAYSLQIYQNLRVLNNPEYADYLFLPFKDATNGESTYGGGRYLDFRQKDISAEGVLVVDFNKAYNPYCAYSDGFNCPVPPVPNHLPFEVKAGEKNFRGEKKH